MHGKSYQRHLVLWYLIMMMVPFTSLEQHQCFHMGQFDLIGVIVLSVTNCQRFCQDEAAYCCIFSPGSG